MSRPDSLLDAIEQQGDGEGPEEVVRNALVVANVRGHIAVDLAAVGMKRSRVDRFTGEVQAFASSRSFLKAASHEIGVPRPGESEDDFVARAKAVILALLRKAFNARKAS